MIYDRGELDAGNGRTLYYVIMEKFEHIPETYDELMSEVLNVLYLQIRGDYSFAETKKVLEQEVPGYEQLALGMRLEKNWLKRLFDDINKLVTLQFGNDYLTMNVGIRRNGAEGYLVFFD